MKIQSGIFSGCLIFAAIAAMLFAGGCSCRKEPKKADVPGRKPAASAESGEIAVEQRKGGAPVMPEKPLVTAPASSLGTVGGTITLKSSGKSTGNLFIFILDEARLPEVSLLGSSVYPEGAIASKKLDFVIKNVPAGERRAIAVWDTSPPYCKIMTLYCAASVKDGLGQSAPFTVAPGGTASGVVINVE